MLDIYKPGDVDDESRPIFEQLKDKFGDSYQIFRHVDDYGRLLEAVVCNSSNDVCARIKIRHGINARPLLGSSEIDDIENHMRSGGGDKLF